MIGDRHHWPGLIEIILHQICDPGRLHIDQDGPRPRVEPWVIERLEGQVEDHLATLFAGGAKERGAPSLGRRQSHRERSGKPDEGLGELRVFAESIEHEGEAAGCVLGFDSGRRPQQDDVIGRPARQSHQKLNRHLTTAARMFTTLQNLGALLLERLGDGVVDAEERRIGPESDAPSHWGPCPFHHRNSNALRRDAGGLKSMMDLLADEQCDAGGISDAQIAGFPELTLVGSREDQRLAANEESDRGGREHQGRVRRACGGLGSALGHYPFATRFMNDPG